MIYLPYFGTGYDFYNQGVPVPIAEVELPSRLEYTVHMPKTLSTDAFTVEIVEIGEYRLYDIKFLQKHGSESEVISSVRLTELQLGMLYQTINAELKKNIEYPHDVYRAADKELETS